MPECLKLTKEAYYYYCLFGMNIAIYVAAVVYLIGFSKKENKLLAEYGVTILVILFFPVIFYLSSKFWLVGNDVWKLYYLLQSVIILSYTMVEFVTNYSGRKKKWIVSGIFVIIMIVSLNYDMTFQSIKPLENSYRIENQILELDQVIKNAKLQKQKMIVPTEVLEQICEYDGSLQLYGTIEGYSIDQALNTEASSYDILNKAFNELQEQGITCIILESEYNNEAVMNQFEYYMTMSINDLYIYER